jgi:hypothetical protein
VIQILCDEVAVFGKKCAKAAAFKQIVLDYRSVFLRKAPFEVALWRLTSVVNSVDQYSLNKSFPNQMRHRTQGSDIS